MTGREAIAAILSHPVAWRGKRQTIAEWVDECGADRGVVLVRLTAGWPLARALTEPPRPPKRWSTRRKVSRFRGVTRHRCGKWYARIHHDGESIDLGLWDDELEAASVVNVAARTWRGLAAKVNLL